jgi:cyclase
MQEVAPNIYVLNGFRGGNVGVIMTQEGLLVIDPPMLSWELTTFWREMRRVADKKVAFVVNTDSHKEKCAGNRFFKEATIIAHDWTWKDMKGYSDTWRQRLIDSLRARDPQMATDFENLEIVLPHITFSKKMILHFGEKTVQVLHIGGHTPGSSMVYDPKESVLFVGDVVVQGEHPFLGQANSKEWLDALVRIRKSRAEIIVPGYGPICDRESTQAVSNYVRRLRSRVRRLYNTGHTKAEMVGALAGMIELFPLGEKTEEEFEQEFKASVGRLYEEWKARSDA